MASKQLGKLRQWAGEVISSRDKTPVPGEFQELEKDMELRRDGIQKLQLASEGYHHWLSKKSMNEALKEGDKLLPIDTLGIVMIVHGEEFGEDSAFGTSLVKLGRAHCKIATLQEACALTLKDTFLNSLDRFAAEIKDYEAMKKKLESRRLSFDAANSKYDKLKNSKKEKDRKEAEEELDRARQRFEETTEDVRALMHAIQDNEAAQLRELTSFMDLEINFVQKYLEVLMEVGSDWNSPGVERKKSQYKSASKPAVYKTNVMRTDKVIRSDVNIYLDSSDDDASRSVATTRQKRSGSAASKPPSRPSSRLSRNRAGSAATVGDKEDASEKTSKLTGWASSAVESVTNRTGRNKDKDKFATLDGDSDEDGSGEVPLKKSRSFRSLSRRSSTKDKPKDLSLLNSSPRGTPKILKPKSFQEPKMVRAIHGFAGSADELSFNAGDEIVVVNEVLDGWWMGELDGRKGLFPTNYTEAVTNGRRAAPTPFRDDDDDAAYRTSDLEEDHELTSQPLSHHDSPFETYRDNTNNHPDEEELQPSPPPRKKVFDDDFFGEASHNHAIPRKIKTRSLSRGSNNLFDSIEEPLIQRSMSVSATASSTPPKKIPPPPPPRRSAPTTPGTSPPIPVRKPKHLQNDSSSSPSLHNYLSAGRSHAYDTSPFESSSDLSATYCTNFKQSPFEQKGLCENCYKYHS